MTEIDLAISCIGSDKNIYCEGLWQFSRRNNIVLKPKVLSKSCYDLEVRQRSLHFLLDTLIGYKVNELASFGFYGAGLAVRCFICQSRVENLYSTASAAKSHAAVYCPFYLDYHSHATLSIQPDISCPLCCADVKFLMHLVPCGHTLCIRCSWHNEVCPYDRIFIVALLRANHVPQ